MSKKKLVVSGDSWTAGTWNLDKDGTPLLLTDDTKNVYKEFPLWPDYLGELLNMEVINLGFGGIGNEFIYNKIVDKLSVIKNVGLAVVCWSGHDRWDFNSYGIYDDDFPDRVDPPEIPANICKTLSIDPSIFDKRISRRPVGWDQNFKLKPLVNLILKNGLASSEHNFFRSLRWYNAFQNYCESNNTPYMQCSAFDKLNNEVISLMLDHPIFDKINGDHFYGWPIFPQIGGFNLSLKLNEVDPRMKNLRVSYGDTHPNREGHKLITKLLYNHYKLLYGEK